MKTIGSHLATLVAGKTKLRWQLAPFVKYVVLLVTVVLLYGWLFDAIMRGKVRTTRGSRESIGRSP